MQELCFTEILCFTHVRRGRVEDQPSMHWWPSQPSRGPHGGQGEADFALQSNGNEFLPDVPSLGENKLAFAFAIIFIFLERSWLCAPC